MVEMHLIPPTCRIGLDDPLRCLLALHISNAETERLRTSQERVAGGDGGGGAGADGHQRQGELQSAASGQRRHCPAALLELRRGEVELNLSLLEGPSHPNTSCLASPCHLPLSGRSSGCLAFRGLGKSKKVFQDIVIWPSSLIATCCPR